MSFTPKVDAPKATPAPVIEKVQPARFETPGDPDSARKSAATGRSALRVNRSANTGLNLPDASTGAGGGLSIPRL